MGLSMDSPIVWLIAGFLAADLTPWWKSRTTDFKLRTYGTLALILWYASSGLEGEKNNDHGHGPQNAQAAVHVHLHGTEDQGRVPDTEESQPQPPKPVRNMDWSDGGLIANGVRSMTWDDGGLGV